jgi:3-hydroxybutyrate dehydrogenase
MTRAGKRALVTGGASGIGRACAEELASWGAHVTVADVDFAAGSDLATKLNGEFWELDLSRPLELADRLDFDILVNNAGIQTVSPIQDFDPRKFQFMIDLMLVAPFMLTRACLPGMYEKGWGRVIHISSVHGLRSSPYKSAYITAKHGIEGLSKVIAQEGGPHGVTSNCINPGYVRTPLVEKQIADQARTHGIAESEVIDKIMLSKNYIKRLVEPAEVAKLVSHLCSEDAAMITGSSQVIDGGWSL